MAVIRICCQGCCRESFNINGLFHIADDHASPKKSRCFVTLKFLKLLLFLPANYTRLMQRRLFLELSAFTAASLSIPFIAGCDNRQQAEARPLFLSKIAEDNSIIKTGLAYRKVFKNEDDEQKLKALLLSQSGLAINATSDEIGQMLARKIDAEFKNGTIIVVNGWVLSATEARQCALFSILQS